jgi:hypothetical protein
LIKGHPKLHILPNSLTRIQHQCEPRQHHIPAPSAAMTLIPIPVRADIGTDHPVRLALQA